MDEVGEIPVDLQSKLLRVLESGEFIKLGDTRAVKVNVRIITATNRDLKAEVGTGKFREDLFYRLNVFTITLPPPCVTAGRTFPCWPNTFYRCFQAKVM